MTMMTMMFIAVAFYIAFCVGEKSVQNEQVCDD